MELKSRKILRKLYYLIKAVLKIRWIKTLRVNFALLPFSQAYKLPIVITCKLEIQSLKGSAVINGPVRFGMIDMGRRTDNMPIEGCPSQLKIKGKIIFNGYCIFNKSSNVCVWDNGVLEVGNFVVVCSGVLLKSTESIKIGDFTRITSGCFVMDTNIHLLRNIETGLVARCFAPIVIGSHCWITMNSSITAGTVIPNYSVVMRGTLVNKDFSVTGEQGLVLGGTPAKIISKGMRRLFNHEREVMITEYFHNNPAEKFYQDVPGFDEEGEDISIEYFKLF